MTAPRFELTSQRQKASRLPTEPPGATGMENSTRHLISGIWPGTARKEQRWMGSHMFKGVKVLALFIQGLHVERRGGWYGARGIFSCTE